MAILPLVRTALDPTQGREHLWIVVDVTARDPEIVGRYQMGRLLGTGAFGAVRLARNLTTGETCELSVRGGSLWSCGCIWGSYAGAHAAMQWFITAP